MYLKILVNGEPIDCLVNSSTGPVLTDCLTRPALHHERPSSVPVYARLRPDGRDTVHRTPVAGHSHSTALDAEQIYVLLTTYITGAAIS